jgi:hypothetical protein
MASIAPSSDISGVTAPLVFIPSPVAIGSNHFDYCGCARIIKALREFMGQDLHDFLLDVFHTSDRLAILNAQVQLFSDGHLAAIPSADFDTEAGGVNADTIVKNMILKKVEPTLSADDFVTVKQHIEEQFAIASMVPAVESRLKALKRAFLIPVVVSSLQTSLPATPSSGRRRSTAATSTAGTSVTAIPSMAPAVEARMKASKIASFIPAGVVSMMSSRRRGAHSCKRCAGGESCPHCVCKKDKGGCAHEAGMCNGHVVAGKKRCKGCQDQRTQRGKRKQDDMKVDDAGECATESDDDEPATKKARVDTSDDETAVVK